MIKKVSSLNLLLLTTLIIISGCNKPSSSIAPLPSSQAILTNCGSLPHPDEIQAEEYTIYAAVIRELALSHRDRRLVIRKHTDAGQGYNPQLLSDDPFGSLPDLPDSLCTNFQLKNAQAATLSDTIGFGPGVEYVLLGMQEADKLLKQGNWEEFYERYPDSSGLLTFSRVGFNCTKDLAIVYVETVGAPLAGRGYYIILEQEALSAQRFVWRIKETIFLWIS